MTTLVDVPAPVDGTQLIGEMVGSGYRTPPALVRRVDGQVLQLTPLLYLVLSAIDGRRGYDEIAERVGSVLGRSVTASDIETLVNGHLRPLGLLKLADGSASELKRSNPLLRLKFKLAVTSPRATRRITDPFRILFRRAVVVPVLLGFLAVVAWVFFDRGLGASAYQAFERPHLLLLVFAVTVLSGGFHEFGHAAAARYGGAQPGVMGAGLYLVWPAFYTDVTDSYRLGRGGRIRTDLGGLYFNAIVVVGTFVWWWVSGWEALLLVVATQVLQMVHQLLPLLRFDGYHLLADIAGVPDLYHRIKPTLAGLLPHRWRSSENRVLKPGARALITLWVLVTIPMMTLMLLGVVMAVPRLLGSAGASLMAELDAVGQSWQAGSALDVASSLLGVFSIVLPTLACALVLSRIGYRFFGGLARWAQGSVVKRVVAAFVSATVITTLAWAWWPDPGTYRPIQPGEDGRLVALFRPSDPVQPAAARSAPSLVPTAGAAANARFASGEPLVAPFEKGSELPTREHPALAMVLVPADGAGATVGEAPSGSITDTTSPALPTESATATSEPVDGTWVFPFDRPLPPEEGDNQALAVNTTDDSVVYDVAFALVWADGDEVLNVNEAHAYASCSNCVAVAVAFQVVLVMDDAQVIVPQNLAVAANYDCYQCITAAIANQLVLSVQEMPGEEDLRSLVEVWNRLLQFAASITSYSLTQVAAQLEAFKAEITDILMDAPPVESAAATATGSPTSSSTATATATTTASPGTSGSSSPTGSPSDPAATASPTSSTSTSSSPSSATSTSSGSTPTSAPSDPATSSTPTQTETSSSGSSTSSSSDTTSSTSSTSDGTSGTSSATSVDSSTTTTNQ